MDIILISVRIAATIPPIDAIQLPDGRRGATVRSLCQALHIAPNMQLVRIRRNPKLAQALVTLPVKTPGGTQQVDVLLDWAVSIWAAGLNVSRLPKAKRAAARIVQQEAFAAIKQAFAQPEADDAPAPEAAAPQAAASEASQSNLRQMREGLMLAVQGVTGFSGEYQVLVERVAALEGRSTGTVSAIRRSG